MRDLISRQAAIDAINRYGSVWMEYTEIMSVDELAERALKASKQSMVKMLHDLPSAQPKIGEWIPCSERLPECNGRYLCANDQWVAWRVDINMWVNGHWRNQIEKPIAWMPLPEPYSIESDGIKEEER